MKILCAKEIQEAEKIVCSTMELPQRILMENAGREIAGFLLEQFGDRLGQGVLVLAGGGNNGGDGFVVARTLLNLGVYSEVALIKPVSEIKGDAGSSLKAFLNSGGEVTELDEMSWSEADCIQGMSGFGLIVDALYGTGFHGALPTFVGEIVEYLNMQAELGGLPVVAVDIPSGVDTDTGEVRGAAVSANTTVALHCLKPAHVYYPGAAYCGEIFVSDIGIPGDLEKVAQVERELIFEETAAVLFQHYITPRPEEHKGERGHVVVLGGGAGHFGAPRMSAEAALICGSGLVSMVVPQLAAHEIGASVRELMVSALDSDALGNFSGTGLEAVAQYLRAKQAVVLGPGMGQSAGAKNVLRAALEFIKGEGICSVIDADALNILAVEKDLQEMLGPKVILTPHPGEMARLLGVSTAEVQTSRAASAQKLSKNYDCWVVLKGARTIIAGPGGLLLVNPAAVPTLATAGSGDVLAGVIGALLGRGFSPQDASAGAVFVHGCAGEIGFVDNMGPVGTVAGDIMGYLPQVINALLRLERAPARKIRKVLPGSIHFLAQEIDARQ